MLPVLKPALCQLWRDPETVQLGIDPTRAVVLTGLDPATRRVLDLLDGSTDREGVLRRARAQGVPRLRAAALLDLLSAADALDDAAAEPAALRALDPEARERIVPEVGALALRRTGAGAGVGGLASRRTRSVTVVGGGRVGAGLAGLLTAAGVGRVVVVDPEVTRPADLAPGGLPAGAVGLPRDAHVPRPLPVASVSRQTRPDLVVLAPVDGLDPALPDRLLADGLPHLLVRVREGVAVLGPLVWPGTSACLGCLDHERAARDPAWPRLAAQLAGAPAPPEQAGDVVLTAALAAHAALQALAVLDLGPGPAASVPDLPVVDGTLELAPPEWRWRRRSWPRSPACHCTWSAVG